MNRPRVEDGALYTVGGQGPGGQDLRDRLGLTPELDEKLRYSSQPKGLPVAELKLAQRNGFVRLVRAYFDHVPEAISAQYESLLSPHSLDGAAFAWAGPREAGAPHYYRIQAQRLLIEYDCTQERPTTPTASGGTHWATLVTT